MPARLRERAHRGKREKSLHCGGGCLKVGNGFEQRHRHDGGVWRAIFGDVVKPRLFQQDINLQHIRNAFGLADIIGGDGLPPELRLCLRCRADDREFFRRFRAIFGPGTCERTVMRQFREQQLHPGLLIQLDIVGDDPRLAQQLRNDPLMHIAILAQIERGQMETEYLDRTDQAAERSAAR